MKKYIIMLCCLAGFATQTMAQENQEKVSLGFHLGPAFSTMSYTSDMYNGFERHWVNGISGGIFANIRLANNFYIRPEAHFAHNGVQLTNETQGYDYRFRPFYVDARIPVVFNIPAGKHFVPFLAIGPSFNYAIGGTDKLNYNGELYDIAITSSSINRFDVSAYGAIGCNYRFNSGVQIGAEVGYNHGFLNTFSQKELDNQPNLAVNTVTYKVDGARLNRGVEVNFTLSLPIVNRTKENEQLKEELTNMIVENTPAPGVDENRVKEIVDDAMKAKEAEDAAKEAARKADPNYFSIEDKECYTLEEMLAFITLRQDISKKKICDLDYIMFDFNKSTLTAEAESYLQEVLRMLYAFPKMQMAVYGHTDNIGTDNYNDNLAKNRAQTVVNWLIQHGIKADRLTVGAFGSHKPIKDNDTDEGRANNRRVEFEILNID